MNIILIVSFLIILAMLLASISVGLRYYESSRRKKLVSMLRTVTEAGVETHVNLLIDEDENKKHNQESKDIASRLARLLSEAGMDWTVQRLIITMFVAFLVGGLIGLRLQLPSPPAIRAFGIGLIASFVPLLVVKSKRTKRLNLFEEQLPEALDFLARSMRAGHAFSISLEMIGEELADPLGHEFRSLFNELNLGASLERSFAGFGQRVPLADVRFFSSAVLLQRQTGGNLSEILNRLSHIIRERFRLKGQVKAASAHGRMTATVLTLLPICTLGGLIITSPGYLDPLMTDPLGRKLVGAGLLFQVLGNYFIQKIIKIKV